MARRLAFFLFLVCYSSLTVFSGSGVATAAPTIEVIERQNKLDYPLAINFGIIVRPSVQAGPNTRANLEYQLVNTRGVASLPAQINRKANGTLELKAKLEARDFIFTGERVRYRWLITFEDGSKSETDSQDILYFDNRFEWHDAAQGLHNIHWYTGDQGYVEQVAKVAENQRASLKQRFGFTSSDKYDLWFYDRQEVMTQVFQDPETRNFLGAAVPIQKVAIMLFPPVKPGSVNFSFYANTLEHEITHLVIFSYSGQILPKWFDEGFATYITDPHPELRRGLVNKVASTAKFIPLDKLAIDTDFYNTNIELAYAEASTLIGYIMARYGDSKISQLVDQFRKTSRSQFLNATLRVLNTNQDELQKDWLAWVKDGSLPVLATPTPGPVPALPDTAVANLIPGSVPPVLIQTITPVLTPTSVPTATISPAPSATARTVPEVIAEAGPAASPSATIAPAIVKTAVGQAENSRLAVNSLLPLIAMAGVLLVILGLGLAVSLLKSPKK